MITISKEPLLLVDPLEQFAPDIANAASALAEIHRDESGQSVSPEYLQATIRRLLTVKIQDWVESIPELYGDLEIKAALLGAVPVN